MLKEIEYNRITAKFAVIQKSLYEHAINMQQEREERVTFHSFQFSAIYRKSVIYCGKKKE